MVSVELRLRCCITGGAVKYEKVGEQLQHTAGSAPQRVSRNRAVAAEVRQRHWASERVAAEATQR